MKRGFLPEDLYHIKVPGKADFSPTGHYLVYMVAQMDESENKTLTNLFLYDLAEQTTQQLTYDGKSHSPVFSPTGKLIAFISSRRNKNQIWLLSLAGGEAWCLPTEQAVSGPLQWSADGQKLFYKADVYSKPADWVPYFGAPAAEGERLAAKAKHSEQNNEKAHSNQVKVITNFKYRADQLGYFGQKRQHIFSVDIGGAVQQCTKGDQDYKAPTLSPDGRWLAVITRQEPTVDLEQKDDIYIYHLESELSYCLYRGSGPLYSLAWDDKGEFLAFTGHDQAAGASSTTDLWLLPLKTFFAEEIKEPLTVDDAINITRDLDRPVGVYGASDLRVRGGKSMAWQEGKLYFISTERGITGVFQLVPGNGLQLVWRRHDVNISSLAVSAGHLALTVSSPSAPEELYLLKINCAKEQDDLAQVCYYAKTNLEPITQLNTSLMEEIKSISWHKIAFNSDDGYPLDGWIFYPSDFSRQKLHPLLLLVHGGPHGAYGPAFMSLVQLFVTNGYVVVYGNPRGSETYGQAHACVIDKNWGDRDYADVLATVEAALTYGGVDPKRIFMYGWSYGGYMACWLATQTTRFKAICGGASVTNLLSGVGTSDINLEDEWEYGGLPWQNPLHLIKHSPVGHAQQVATPLLLMHGEKDLRVPISQTEEFYTALKRLDKEVVMIRYPDEYHGLKQPQHQVDRLQRLLAWFNAYAEM